MEDDPSLCLLLCELLRPEYEVEIVPDGEQAWESVRRPPPDLVLADVRLKHTDLDGGGLIQRLRSQERTAGLLIVLLTGCNKPETLARGFEAGADDFLLKPFRPPELLTRLRSHRRLIEMRRELVTRQCASA